MKFFPLPHTCDQLGLEGDGLTGRSWHVWAQLGDLARLPVAEVFWGDSPFLESLPWGGFPGTDLHPGQSSQALLLRFPCLSWCGFPI